MHAMSPRRVTARPAPARPTRTWRTSRAAATATAARRARAVTADSAAASLVGVQPRGRRGAYEKEQASSEAIAPRLHGCGACAAYHQPGPGEVSAADHDDDSTDHHHASPTDRLS